MTGLAPPQHTKDYADRRQIIGRMDGHAVLRLVSRLSEPVKPIGIIGLHSDERAKKCMYELG